MTDGRIVPEVMVAYIANAVMADDTAAVMAENTDAVMADNTENLDTADLGHAETEGVALAYIAGPRKAERQDIPLQAPHVNTSYINSIYAREEINIRIMSHGLSPNPVSTTIVHTLCCGVSPALIMHINPIGYVLLSMVLSLLVDILPTRLIMRPNTSSRPFTLPHDNRALLPSSSSMSRCITWKDYLISWLCRSRRDIIR
ncbi:hypothetical protein PIB30_094930 [Stylosanthes scabra]|uniref:Uncharacterized protein n=1 Tax=Stylosanthes scabra TaxID=79078 RepID=A0ABU6RW03_9FABA|nr:hypothetical protein [Stylosanthes scabra]